MTAAAMDNNRIPGAGEGAGAIPDPPPGASLPATPPPPPMGASAPPEAPSGASYQPPPEPSPKPASEAGESRFSLGRLGWGVGLLLVGGLLYLERIDWIFYEEARRFWPLILVVLGVAVTAFAKGRESRRTGLWIVAWGAWFLLIVNDVWGLWGGNAWPLLIIAGGFIDLVLPKEGKGRISSLFTLGLGFWLLANTLDLWGITWRGSWPLILVLLGGVLILEALFEDGGGRLGKLRDRRGDGAGSEPQAYGETEGGAR